MASWLGFPPFFNKTDPTSSKSTTAVGFHSLSLPSDGSLNSMQQYFRATPSGSNPYSHEYRYGSTSANALTSNSVIGCTDNPKLEDFLDSYYQGNASGTEIHCNSRPSLSPPQSPSNYMETQNSCHYMQSHIATNSRKTSLIPSSDSVYNVGVDGCTSISEIKSWLRQSTAFGPDKQTGQSSPTLSMGQKLQFDEVIPADGFKVHAVEVSDTLNEKLVEKESVPKKPHFGQRTSQYRGVTRHRWTGRYEAHLWDNSSRKEGQTRKGRQGGYDKEEKAARAYDLAALKYWGPPTHINFPFNTYEKELEEMKHMSRQEYIAHLRRNSSGFSRGASIYRGVTRHHQHGRWQARIGRVARNKDLYLGTFS
ncbi:AP2-like ethylene-responsive transcription factor ANT isoform X2 [Carex littledalei]|uniref:AP2-like ethylene-responsive transcription factor ANT isoform X2 n=1 Tax=Carex littledalei TaxID=544730 RepID=A0A833VCS7_9POAL|nr:AP2-like ethylene-responsive transcription factor ANT isoform X2 [Carex littledalei]